MAEPSRSVLFVMALICGVQGCAISETNPPAGPPRRTHPDYDGDGYADLAVGSPAAGLGRGRIDLFRGGPAGPADVATHTVWGPTASRRFGTALRQVGDLDVDGKDDLVVAESDGTEHLVRGGRDVLEAPQRLSTSATRGGGDLNADGVPDLVGFSARSNDAVWIPGGGPIDAAQDIFTAESMLRAEAMVIADLSGDGIGDLVFAFDSRLVMLAGGRSFPGAAELVGYLTCAPGSAPCQLNRLGRFLTTIDSVTVEESVWVPSATDTDPRDVTTDETWSEPELRAANAIAVGDLDGDGFDDVFAHGSRNPLAYWLSGGAEPIRPIELPPYAPHEIATGIDFDADGRSELVGRGGVWLGELADPGMRPSPRPLVVEGALEAAFASLVAGDFDGDGDDDLMDGWNRFDGSAEGWPSRASVDSEPIFDGTAVADFDGDGDDEVYAGGRLRRGGVDGLESPSAAVADLYPWWDALAGEIDLIGDARPDLIFVDGTPDSVLVIAGSASGLGVRQTLSTAPAPETGYSYMHYLDAGDVDGDGRGDVVFIATIGSRSPRSNCVVLSASGVQVVAVESSFCEPVGDVDGDGRVDLLQEDSLTSYVDGSFVSRPILGSPPSNFMVRPHVAGRRGPAEWVRLTGDTFEVRLDAERGFVVEHRWPIPASLGPIDASSVLVADSDGDGKDEYVVLARLQSGAGALVVSDDGASVREFFATIAPSAAMAGRFP